jgi:hypothetical protein
MRRRGKADERCGVPVSAISAGSNSAREWTDSGSTPMIHLTLIVILITGGVAAFIVGLRSRRWAIAIMLLAIAIDVATIAASFLLYAYLFSHS